MVTQLVWTLQVQYHQSCVYWTRTHSASSDRFYPPCDTFNCILLFCVVKRKTRDNHKGSSKANAVKKDNLSSTVTIVPSSPQNSPQHLGQTYVVLTSLIPIKWEYQSATTGMKMKQKALLISQSTGATAHEELKQQQQMHQQRDNCGGVSVISNNTINRNQPILSPYNSWSASQLLHEHERRHSPMDGNMMEQEQMMVHQEILVNGDHMSINGQNMDHMSLNSHQMQEHYPKAICHPRFLHSSVQRKWVSGELQYLWCSSSSHATTASHIPEHAEE
nr:unnamed protein product [Callosobruchus chinensis]